MFRATAEAGVRYLRMDFAASIVFQSGKPDFESVERVNALAAMLRRRGARRDHDHAVVHRRLPGRQHGSPRPLRAGARVRAKVAADGRSGSSAGRPNVRHWELGNEPDSDSAFIGGPAEYARWAALAADGIRAAAPDAAIAIGGLGAPERGVPGGRAPRPPLSADRLVDSRTSTCAVRSRRSRRSSPPRGVVRRSASPARCG